MSRVGLLALVAVAICGCASQAQQLPPATASLVNPSFDQPGRGMAGWAQRGDEYGRGQVVTSPVASPPGSLELSVEAANSIGERSFMVYQVLDPGPYRGRRVRFGAKIRTDGGAVNLTLYTPEKTANDFFQNLHVAHFVDRGGILDVPRTATFLSLGIQIMGSRGAKAYVDDVFVRVEGDGGHTPAATDPPVSHVPAKVTVEVDATTPGRAVPPLVFGMHVEWADAGNGIVDRRTGTLRADVLEALQPLRIPLFRYPGGIHADYYDWKTGTAPRDRRPKAHNVFTGSDEPQLFGTSEFVHFLERTGAQPLLTANYGTGSPEQAADWARYFAASGVPARYWEIGNEIYLADPERDQPNGRRIAKSGEQYAADFPRYREAIRSAAPDAQVGLIAHVDTAAFPLEPRSRRDWTSRVLAALTVRPDFVAVHNAYAPVIIDNAVRFDDDNSRERVYRALYAASGAVAHNLQETAALLDGTAITKGVPIGVTEWGPLFGYSNRPDMNAWYVDQSRTMAAAVYVASILDTLLGNDRVSLAAYTNPIHRWYGGLLTDTDGGLIRTPTYYVFSMYRQRFESRLLPVSVVTPAFESPAVGIVPAQLNVPEVLARAASSADGRRITVMLVNRSLGRTEPVRLRVRGSSISHADCELLAASSPNAINGPGLTTTTSAWKSIAPKVVACAGGPEVAVSLPPSAVLSVVLERL